MSRPAPALYGLMAEFASAEALLVAARRTYAEGYREIEAYSPLGVSKNWGRGLRSMTRGDILLGE